MAISSQRFQFLDRETNVGTSDFLSLTDNSVYTAAMDTADTVANAIREGESILSTMEESISDLMDKVSKASDAIMQKIKDALNTAIDKIMNMKLPKFISKILDSVKELDLGGVKAFFKDLLRVGSAFLCNNLDFLKSFMLGYSLTENILSGLMIGLVLSWLDRYCKGFTKQEVLAASNKGKLGMLFSNDGVTLTLDTVLGKFSNAYADLVRYSRPYTPNLPYGTQEFLTEILSGRGKEGVSNLRNAEISSKQRKEYLTFLEQNVSLYQPNTPEYNAILDTRAQLINTPLISEERIERANNYANLNDALGSIALNLKGIDIKDINTYTLSETEKTLLTKLEEFKISVEQNQDIQTRTHEQGAFTDFNFSTVLPEPTLEEKQYLETLKGLEESYRYNGLHPTTEVFTESTMPYSTRLTPEKEPIEQRTSNNTTLPIGVIEVTNTPPSNPVLGSTFIPGPSGSVILSSNTLNSNPGTNSSLSKDNLFSEPVESVKANTGVNGTNSTSTSTVNKLNNLPSQGTGKFDKPYIPTPVIPGSCYA